MTDDKTFLVVVPRLHSALSIWSIVDVDDGVCVYFSRALEAKANKGEEDESEGGRGLGRVGFAV